MISQVASKGIALYGGCQTRGWHRGCIYFSWSRGFGSLGWFSRVLVAAMCLLEGSSQI